MIMADFNLQSAIANLQWDGLQWDGLQS